jgi:hypothetical protein
MDDRPAREGADTVMRGFFPEWLDPAKALALSVGPHGQAHLALPGSERAVLGLPLEH